LSSEKKYLNQHKMQLTRLISIETNWIETYLMHLTIFGQGRKICDLKWTKRTIWNITVKKKREDCCFKYCEAQSQFIERCENEFIEWLFSANLCFRYTKWFAPQKRLQRTKEKVCNTRKENTQTRMLTFSRWHKHRMELNEIWMTWWDFLFFFHFPKYINYNHIKNLIFY